jgi:sulfofructose kinase
MGHSTIRHGSFDDPPWVIRRSAMGHSTLESTRTAAHREDMDRRNATAPAHVLCVGSVSLDHVYSLTSPLVRSRKNVAESYLDIGGGVAANAAVTVTRLGCRATLLGCVGTGPVGDLVVDELRSERIDVHLIRRLEDAATAESVVLVEPGGERTIVGHAPAVAHEHSPRLSCTDFDGVLVDARWPDATRAALELAAARGLPGVVDVDRLPFDTALRHDVFRLASHLVFSRSALEALTGVSDPACALHHARHLTSAHLSVTCGADGVLWLHGREVRRLPAFDIDVVDTTGAGDVFHGAFTVGLAEHMSEEHALRFAAGAAALKCSRPGARMGIPTRHDVTEFLASRPQYWCV